MKRYFLQAKRIKQMLDEQENMFKNLPDGAIIHRSVAKEQGDTNHVSALDSIKIEINYFNESFYNMFVPKQEKNEIVAQKKEQVQEKYQQVSQESVDIELQHQLDLGSMADISPGSQQKASLV